MDSEIKAIVEIASNALKEEDSYLSNSVKGNSIYANDQTKGILRFNNERFYQYIIAREMLKVYPGYIDLEKDTHDLVIYGSESNKYKIVVEMKRWMSSGGASELPGIKSDVSEKLSVSNSDKSLMLVFSSNPDKDKLTEENIKFLTNEIRSVGKVYSSHFEKFPVSYKSEIDNVFWVAGFEIKRPNKGN